jgi:pyrroloquinoline quinone biosynthesis protein E
MPDPCQSCERKIRDWGGCRCQAFAFTGEAGTVDPACSKAPTHAAMRATALAEAGAGEDGFDYRTM